MNERYAEVLLQYELNAAAIRRGRGSWLCETDQGLKLLREYKGTVKRLEFEDQVLEQVQDQSGLSIDRYVRNREGELISTAEDGTRYILKDWYDDGECNIRDSSEIARAIATVARLHKIFRGIQFREEWNMGSILAQPPDTEMGRHNQELKRARTFIRNKRKKTEFELCVIADFDMFYRQADEARLGMELLYQRTEKIPSYLCHGDLNQHHILMGDRGAAVVEFNRMHYGLQMADLYHFMRKVMEKHNWSLPLGVEMLDAYEKILPLTRADRECLYYLFLYPEKYWKQINFYYNANKAWIPARNIEKLKNLEQQQEYRNHFLSVIK